MTAFAGLLLAAITITAADRLAMADRLFNKGAYQDALKEYVALYKGDDSVRDDLLFRLAECYRAVGRTADARRIYTLLVKKHPNSKFVARSRLMAAIAVDAGRQKEELLLLDSDSVPNDIRAAALYYLGIANNDAEKLARSIRLDPKGKYAPYAKLRRASILATSGDQKEKRDAVQLLTDIAFGPESEFSEDALYLAAATSYSDKKYRDAGNLLHRYLKSYPDGKHKSDVIRICAWCDYLQNKYADTLALCQRLESDDTVYLAAAAHYALAENELALGKFREYLQKYPTGRYRNEAELPLARLEFNEAEKSDDRQKLVDAAQRAANLSTLPADHLRLAWAYEKNSRFEDAVREYAAIAAANPGTREAAEAMYLKAMVDLREGRWNAADLALKEALDGKLEQRRVAEARYWRGIASVKLEHEEEGVRLLREALEAGLSLDMTREAKLIIADFEYNAGNVETAKAAYRELVANGAAARMSAKKAFMVGKLISSRECAKALIDSETPEWRQAGYALLGQIEEADSNFRSAMDAYRRAVDELVETDELPKTMLRLGVLETDNGDFDSAHKTLVKAVDLNKDDVLARAEAYLNLAKVAAGKHNREEASGYATVVATLFDKTPFAAEAERILEENR
ncbi:MAG: tetratricopeptide repeat protein [Kiritimatiellae bacterium]|nr:tetratricopeptide repeat protein [Kiritimatiellia bacterium]